MLGQTNLHMSMAMDCLLLASWLGVFVYTTIVRCSQPYFSPCAHARVISGWGEGSLVTMAAGICADESARSSHVTVPNVA